MVDNIYLRIVGAIDHKAAVMIHGKYNGEATVQVPVYADDSLAHGRIYPSLANFNLDY
jgi:hypothetical protein